MPSLYYIYFHICQTTGQTFYIGKGTGYRAYKKDTRSIKWKAYVAENGYDVFIFKAGLTEDEALRLEDKLIKIHKEFGFLVNVVGVAPKSRNYENINQPTSSRTSGMSQ